MIGIEVDYNYHTRKGNPRTVTGKVVDAKKFMGHIARIDDPEYIRDGYKYKIKPLDGSRAIWTQAFPLKD